MAIELTFVDELPPGGPGRPKKYSEHVQALRARPGKWAIIEVDIKQPSMPSLRKAYGPDFEFAVRDHRKVDGHSRGTLYGRLIAKTATPAAAKVTQSCGGMVLMCDDCDFECASSDAAGMTRHVRQAHERRVSAAERTPSARNAAA